MPALCRTARIAVSCAAVACAGWSWSAHEVRPRTTGAPARAEDRAPFRLGTAARPFGWSSAIGDLNADGRPDYAIADRLFRRASGFTYSLEFVIAGAAPRSVTFDAPSDALTVSLRDVDHDRDLDVVVTTVVSRAIVGVWLNDGVGRFHRAAAALPDQSESTAGSTATDRRTDAGTAESMSPRPDDALISVLVWRVARRPASSIAAGDTSRNRLVQLSGLRPRAPPISA